MPLSSSALDELADAFGIATEFWDWKGRRLEVTDDTVVAILAGMGIDASDPGRAVAAVEAQRDRTWARLLPACTVMQQGRAHWIFVHVPHGDWVRVGVRLENGGHRDVPQREHNVAPRWIGGRAYGEAAFELPADLPLGYHQLEAVTESGTGEATLVVSPHFLGFPAAMDGRRVWGYAVQLYSIRSTESWGIGDLQDLSDLAVWSATQHRAGSLLTNPLHAAEAAPPIEPSPYLPASRRFVNPLYVRPEGIAEYAVLDAARRALVDSAKAALAEALADDRLIQRNVIWDAKLGALRAIHAHGMSAPRRMAYDAFARREGQALTEFATWCALVNRYGTDWRTWPAALRQPSSAEVAAFAADHAEDIAFFSWVQWVADLQLRSAQATARDAGMPIGVMADLAVGVGPASAEAWAYGELFATGVRVGALPDPFNQLGQNWNQVPWRPDRLEELSYAPFRSIVAGLLRHAGGVRVDHVMGLFRLWWIPDGMPPTKGAYVRQNYEAMVGILLLEAQRAGALVVGEDLGVVEPWVRDYLRDRGVLGTSILWFEKDGDGTPLQPEQWREYCLASLTSHDLPPTAGYLARTHVRLQHELGLLTGSLESELAAAGHEQEAFVALLRDRGFLAAGEPTTEDLVLALHRYLAATPSRLLCVALSDAVGDGRTQNQPGTIDEYPNWRVPLSHPDGTPMTLEEVYADERARRLAQVMNGATNSGVVPPPGVATAG